MNSIILSGITKSQTLKATDFLARPRGPTSLLCSGLLSAAERQRNEEFTSVGLAWARRRGVIRSSAFLIQLEQMTVVMEQ